MPVQAVSPAKALDSIVDSLQQRGVAVADGLLPCALWKRLAQRAKEAFARGKFRPARIGALRQRDAAIRGDCIAWWPDAPEDAAEQAYLRWIEALRRKVNERFFLGAFSFEAHYARYAPGARYRRHNDCLRGSDARALTVICYLNEHWQPDCGGALRLYLPDGTQDVLPKGGRIVTFFSAEIEHEVLPARRERWSLTGWLRRRTDPI